MPSSQPSGRVPPSLSAFRRPQEASWVKKKFGRPGHVCHFECPTPAQHWIETSKAVVPGAHMIAEGRRGSVAPKHARLPATNESGLAKS